MANKYKQNKRNTAKNGSQTSTAHTGVEEGMKPNETERERDAI